MVLGIQPTELRLLRHLGREAYRGLHSSSRLVLSCFYVNNQETDIERISNRNFVDRSTLTLTLVGTSFAHHRSFGLGQNPNMQSGITGISNSVAQP